MPATKKSPAKSTRTTSRAPSNDAIKFLTAEDATVAHVVSIREEVAPVAEGAEVAAAAPGAPAAEPEVAKKGKPEAEAPAKK